MQPNIHDHNLHRKPAQSRLHLSTHIEHCIRSGVLEPMACMAMEISSSKAIMDTEWMSHVDVTLSWRRDGMVTLDIKRYLAMKYSRDLPFLWIKPRTGTRADAHKWGVGHV